MQYSGGNRRRQGRELAVTNDHILTAHFGSTDLGRFLILPSSDLLKMEGRERDIGFLEQTWRENDKEHTLCQERHCCVRMQQRLMTGHVVLHRCR